MITGIHALIYSKDAEADRGFFRDVLKYPFVDAHGGWLIFALPPAELGVHPSEDGDSHELHLMCDDVKATMAELKKKGVKFTRGVQDMGYGLTTVIELPGGSKLGLYEPRHPSPLDLSKSAAAPAKRKAAAGKKAAGERTGGARAGAKRPAKRAR